MLGSRLRAPFSLFTSAARAPVAKLGALAEFAQGKVLMQKQQFHMAELEFRRALQILDHSAQTDSQCFAIVNTEIALALSSQQKPQQAEKLLDCISLQSSGDLLWPTRRNQIAHCLRFAPATGETRASTLLSDPRLSHTEREEARFLAALVKSEELRPFALHNCACAKWFAAKSYSPLDSTPSADPSALATVITDLHTSICELEGISAVAPENELPGTSAHTGQSLTTLASVHLSNRDPAYAAKWLKASLKYHEKRGQQTVARTLVLLAGILLRENNVLHAEGMLKYALDLSTAQKDDFTACAALKQFVKVLETMPKRDSEWMEVIARIRVTEQKLPPWAEVASYLQVPVAQSL